MLKQLKYLSLPSVRYFSNTPNTPTNLNIRYKHFIEASRLQFYDRYYLIETIDKLKYDVNYNEYMIDKLKDELTELKRKVNR